MCNNIILQRYLKSVLEGANFEPLHVQDVPVRAKYFQVGCGGDVVVAPEGRQEFQ